MQPDSLDFVSSSSLPDTEPASGNLMLSAGGFDYKTLQYIQSLLPSLRHGLRNESRGSAHS